MKLKGVTAVWFMDITSVNLNAGAGKAYHGVTGTLNLNGLSGSKSANKGTLRNYQGDTIGCGYNDQKIEAQLTYVPSGDTAAELLSALTLPDAGQELTLVETVNGTATFISAQTWIFEGVDFNGDLDNPRGFTMRFMRYPDQPGVSADAVATTAVP